jgi:hypothetical protein
MPQLNQRDAVHYIATERQFTASALSGSSFKRYTIDAGRLNAEEYAKLNEATHGEEWVYVVFSYGTPIAWRIDGGEWYVVSQKFSPTTSKHQNLTRRAIAESLEGATV